MLAFACYYLLIVEKYKHYKIWFFNKSCLNKKDLILQTEHRSPTQQHGLPGVYFKLEVLSRWVSFRLDIHWSTKQNSQSPIDISQRKWYFSMNKTNERADLLIAPAVTLNLKELQDKGFSSSWKMAVKSEGQDSHNRQWDASLVCSTTKKLLLLNQESKASVSSL